MSKEIPIFFAADDCYAPLLAVALNSAVKNSNSERTYRAVILQDGITEENSRKLKSLESDNFKIDIMPMKQNFDMLDDRMSNRLRCDYFTLTIYFRLFIPAMFPEYDKAIYIDSDVVIADDIAKLFDIDIGDNLPLSFGTDGDGISANWNGGPTHNYKELKLEYDEYYY